MGKIRLLHLTSTRYGIGGVEKLLLDMSDKYNTDEFEVLYCNLFCDAEGAGVFPSALRDLGLKVLEVKGRKWSELPKMVADLARLLRRENIDIIHLHMLQATLVGGLAAEFSRSTRVVVTKHYDEQSTVHHPLVKKLDTVFTRAADRIVAISEHVKNDMARLSIPIKRITVIHNGTDLMDYDERSQVPSLINLRATGRSWIVGTVGSLTPRKGHRSLLQAVPLVLQTMPAVHFIIIGEGPEKEDLEALCRSLGIENNVTMLGFQENVPPLLRQLDLYVHPSKFEPFGIAILEAMASAKCVIATAVGGVQEIVADGETGFLIPSEDPVVMAQSIMNALKDADGLQICGQNGRRRVEQLFNIRATVKNYEELYREMVEPKTVSLDGAS